MADGAFASLFLATGGIRALYQTHALLWMSSLGSSWRLPRAAPSIQVRNDRRDRISRHLR